MEKGGLTTALTEVGITHETTVAMGDEMRLGLIGQVRKRWCPKGHKLIQPIQVVYVWRYLILAIDGRVGRVYWRWIPNMKQDSIRETLVEWREAGLQGVVWDNASSHRAKSVRTTGMKLVGLPPYSPELNPAERVFEEIRRVVEGRVYPTIEDKIAAVESYLTQFAADPERVRRLAGWGWIDESFANLPRHDHAA